jgi:hypothetical protein
MLEHNRTNQSKPAVSNTPADDSEGCSTDADFEREDLGLVNPRDTKLLRKSATTTSTLGWENNIQSRTYPGSTKNESKQEDTECCDNSMGGVGGALFDEVGETAGNGHGNGLENGANIKGVSTTVFI